MSFRQFLAEGILAVQRAKLMQVKQAIASAFKVNRFEVMVNRVVDTQEEMAWIIALRLSDENDVFHFRMFDKMVRRELDKHFDRWKLESSNIEVLADSPMAVFRFRLPDAE